jgi:hypothetical protein
MIAFQKFLLLLIIMLPFRVFSQAMEYSASKCENGLSKPELDSLARFKRGKITFYTTDQKLKYSENRRNKKRKIIYYHPDGSKCKEQRLNYRTKVSRTVFFENGKRFMVCKGTLKN